MVQIRVMSRLAIIVTCLVCLGFNVGMCSDSDLLIKTYVSSSLPSNNDFIYSAKLMAIDSVTESEWDSLVIQSEVPVMVMFTAKWCDPCRMMRSIMDAMASNLTGRFKFYVVDFEQEESIVSRYNVFALPTNIVFKGGEEVARVVGFNVRRVRELVDKYV
ncbi:hypothetical protein EUTSA_v10011839mg [Eutrema salsugineum]|uniref:Thioredoxin domain-containing protein n=1 Tax=Eutrema salsugineum TaxID=72664 RepID=V4KS09_EUTSA|nr:uncharacterized protein LOC18010842 [Eutrema salsugineum]ESQ30133.1 hypothetical protein EUTSA_v10011839mg [Eutrema salsugineum]